MKNHKIAVYGLIIALFLIAYAAWKQILFIFIVLLVMAVLFGYALLQIIRRSSLFSYGDMALRYINEIEQEKQMQQKQIDGQNDIIERIRQIDVNFSIADFKQMVKTSFTLYLKCKSFDDDTSIDELRRYASPSFMSDYIEELSHIKSSQNLQYRSIRIDDVQLKDLQIQDHMSILQVQIMACYSVAVYNTNHTMIRLKEERHSYDAAYLKTVQKTGFDTCEETIVNCPNCGAPVDVVKDTHCPYCHSAIYQKVNIWVLHDVSKYVDNVR